MRQPIGKGPIIGGWFGFLLGIAVLTYGYLEPHIHAPAINDWFIFIACPSSMALIAADNSKWYFGVVADWIVVAANAVWYGLLFTVVAMLFQRGVGGAH